MKPPRAEPGAAGGARPSARELLLLVCAALPVPISVVLCLAEVPLGAPGRLVYPYSPVISWRLGALPPALLIGVGLALGVGLVGAAAANWRRIGFGVLALGIAASGVWVFLAPPDYCNQHVFNAQSPSQDGAFVREALGIVSLRGYLADFPQRALTPPEQMRGTRVISNPPGATLLAAATVRLVDAWPELRGAAERMVGPEAAAHPEFQRWASIGLVFFWLLIALWLAAWPLLYGCGRLFFGPPAAAAYATCALLGPMTLLFAPGKDAAQLLTTALPLLLWLIADRRGVAVAAFAAGGVFVAASMVSLVHVWVGVALVAAGVLARLRDGAALRRYAVLLGAAAGGALAAALIFYVAADLNVWATVRAVARSQAEVTRGPGAMPLAWQLLGVPLFLLFAGPALWFTWLSMVVPARGPADVSLPEKCGDRANGAADARFGRALLFVTAVVLLATAGFTNLETPRLWIPFVPLLLLGGLLPLRVRNAGRARQIVLVALVFVQIAFAAAQWTLMDMRETEMRLKSGVFFGSPPAP